MDWFVDIPEDRIDQPDPLNLFESAALALGQFLAVKGGHGEVALAMTPAPPPVRLYQATDDSFAELVFPGFDADSFIWKMSAFQIAEFLFSLASGQEHGNPTTCTLYRLGASWGPAIAGGQIQRLLLPMTLHANMM